MKNSTRLIVSFFVFFLSLPFAINANAQICVNDDAVCDQGTGNYCYYGIDNDCVSNEDICGDGRLWEGEQCDNNGYNSDSVPDQCRSDCRLPWCGDGVMDTGFANWVGTGTWEPEFCDHGDRNSNFQPNACREDCTLPFCGDGIIDNTYGEECDEGAGNSDLPNATCSTQCNIPGCGNGILETWEQCDDGNTSDSDGCTSQCRLNVCGDGLVWSDGDVESCEYETAWDRGECRYDCGLNVAVCGNGAIDPGEECDDGSDRNSDEPNNPCRTNCEAQGCGDGILDTGEVCDLQEGCAPDCTWTVAR